MTNASPITEIYIFISLGYKVMELVILNFYNRCRPASNQFESRRAFASFINTELDKYLA